MKLHRLFSLLSACLVLFSCASAPPPPPPAGDRSGLDLWFRDWAQNQTNLLGFDGLSVALVDVQGEDRFYSFGNAGQGRKVDARSVFNVGSISKILMPVAVLVLVERGQMDLDAPVRRYVPEFAVETPSGKKDTITIRSLLTHESGLVSDIEEGWFLKGSGSPTGAEYRGMVQVLNQTPVSAEPWTQHSYSNAAFSLLAVAVERASGEDYAAFVVNHILRPWGMNDSGFAYGGLDPAHLVQGIVDGKEVPVPAIRDLPAGLFCSSAHDMALLVRGLLGDRAGAGKVLKAQSIAELWKVQNGAVRRDVDLRMGLTFVLRPLGALGLENLAWHDGELTPFKAELCLDPEQGLGVFVVTNSGTDDLRSFLVQGMRSLVLARTGQDPEVALSKTRSPSIPTPPGLLQTLPGLYQLPLGLFNVTRRGETLVAEAFGLKFRLQAHEDDSLTLHPELFGMISGPEPFEEIALKPIELDGELVLSLVYGDLPTGIGKKLTPVVLSAAWEHRQGPWQQVGGSESYVLIYDRTTGTLSADGRIALRPLSDGLAVTDGYGRGMNERIEAGQDDKGPWLRYSGMELRPAPR